METEMIDINGSTSGAGFDDPGGGLEKLARVWTTSRQQFQTSLFQKHQLLHVQGGSFFGKIETKIVETIIQQLLTVKLTREWRKSNRVQNAKKIQAFEGVTRKTHIS